jgi:hypothetical protein
MVVSNVVPKLNGNRRFVQAQPTFSLLVATEMSVACQDDGRRR